MIINELSLKGIVEVVLEPHYDNRGLFMRSYDDNIYEKYGIIGPWVQENHSISLKRNTIRGLHFILPPHTDGKLIRCIRGKVLDVIIDLRKHSTTQGHWISIKLKEDDYKWIYIPKGFAHGFCTLCDRSEIYYKHNVFYNKELDCGIKWDDPTLKINWPSVNPIISEKDKNLLSYAEFLKK